MEITQERLNELRSQIQIDKPLGSLLQESLVVGETPDDERLAAAAASHDCKSFRFNIEVLKISGCFCKTGKLEIRGSVFGTEIGHTVADLSKKDLCLKPGVGKLLRVKFCFSLRNNCLYTRGEIDGFFTRIARWKNRKILCF